MKDQLLSHHHPHCPRLTRRHFLLLASVGLVEVGLGGCGISPAAQHQSLAPTPGAATALSPTSTPTFAPTSSPISDSRSIVKAIVREKLAYLTLDEEGLDLFAQDYSIYAQSIPDATLAVAYMQGLTQWQEPYTSEVATFFLLSSDFSWQERDIGNTVSYQGKLYDAYRSCSNPFAERLNEEDG